jgi:hypothetical protein
VLQAGLLVPDNQLAKPTALSVPMFTHEFGSEVLVASVALVVTAHLRPRAVGWVA